MSSSIGEPYQAIPNRLLEQIRDPAAVVAYAWCRRYSDWDTGVLRHSAAEIARRMGVTAKTLSRHLMLLLEAGWMVLEGPNGLQRWRVIPPGASITPTRTPPPSIDADPPSQRGCPESVEAPKTALGSRKTAVRSVSIRSDRDQAGLFVLGDLQGSVDQLGMDQRSADQEIH